MGRALRAIVLAGLSLASYARADDAARARCEASYEAAQRFKREEHLSAAKSQLEICNANCPPALASDCARWLNDVMLLMPTVRLSAKDDAGAPLPDARVFLDGQLLEVRALSVEPGPHVFRFERIGHSPAEVRAEIHAGERDLPIEAILVRVVEKRPRPLAAPPRPSHTPSYVVGGIGAAALVAAGALTLKGHLDRSALRSSCYPYCSEDDVQPIRTEWITAAALAGFGAVAAVVAVVLWTAGERSVALSASPRGAALLWTMP
jgi:hypothetical protein